MPAIRQTPILNPTATSYELPDDDTVADVTFLSQVLSSANVVLNGVPFSIKEISNQLVFDQGGANEHTFTQFQEIFQITVAGDVFQIIWQGQNNGMDPFYVTDEKWIFGRNLDSITPLPVSASN
jgi:hypothetical protein